MKIFKEYGERYTSKGFHVTPTKGKIPICNAWQTKGSTEFDKYQTCNIGLLTGKLSSIVAVDVDTDDQKVNDFFASKTTFIRVGRKGAAYFFAYEEKFADSKKVHPLEFFSNGGQVILPPSIHPETKAPYVWLEDNLLDAEIEDLPKLDIDIYKFLESYLGPDSPTKERPHGRNNKLTEHVAAKVLDNVDPMTAIKDLIKEDKSLHGDHALFEDPRENKGRVDIFTNAARFYYSNASSVLRHNNVLFKPYCQKMTIKEYDETKMTEDFLPEPLRAFVNEGVRTLNVPMENIAIPLIASFSAILKNVKVRRIKDQDYETPTIMWSMGLMRKGTRKSASLNYSTQFLRDIQVRLDEIRKEKVHNNRFQINWIEAQIAHFQKRAKGTPAKLPTREEALECICKVNKLEEELLEVKPDHIYFTYNETTTAGLIDYLENSPHGLVNIQDELSSILSNFQTEHSSGMRTLLLSAHNCKGRYEKKLVKQSEPTVLEDFCVTIIGMTQPAILKNIFSGAKFLKEDDGFLERFQLIYFPEEPAVRRLDRGAYDPTGARVVRELFMKLFFGEDGKVNLSRGVPVTLTPDAENYFVEFVFDLHKKVRDTSESYIKGFMSKSERTFISLATIFFMLDDKRNTQIETRHLELAARWVNLLVQHARRVNTLL